MSSSWNGCLRYDANGSVQAFRNQQDKEKFPHRLHLDRRGLTSIPEINEEINLQFLSLKHNLITTLDNIYGSKLKELVCLDLYDNQIELLKGVHVLLNLRILLIGRNRIKSTSGLECLSKLELLDLHDNRITCLDDLITLDQLKVLNLAGNLIKSLRPFDLLGLKSLQELNLKRNKIKKLNCTGVISSVIKLNLSNNDIRSLEDLNSIVSFESLRDLSIEGNPVSLSCDLVTYLVSILPNIQIISNMQVSDQVRKAAVGTRGNKYGREEAKEDGEPELADAPLRLPPLSTVPNHPDAILEHPPNSDDNKADSERKEKVINGKIKLKNVNKIKEQGGDYIVEIKGRILNVVGQGSLRYVDRPWNPVKAADVTTIKFSHVDFSQISLILNKLKTRFPRSEHFNFTETNISCLGQINALSDLQGMTSLTIAAPGNPITNKQWRTYAVYRLSHWGLKYINNIEVTQAEVSAAEKEYYGLTEIVVNCLPDSLLEPLLNRLQLIHDATEPRQWVESADPAIKTVVAKEALQWKRMAQEDMSPRLKGKEHLEHSINFTLSALVKLKQLRREWPSILHEIIRDTLVDYSHINSYMKNCISQL